MGHAPDGTLRRIRLLRDDGGTTDLALADPDAACWAEAADLVAPVASVYGMSLCRRPLALVTLIAEAGRTLPDWTAAVSVPLTGEALFEPDGRRARIGLATSSHATLLGASA